jgi:hypothetical protein
MKKAQRTVRSRFALATLAFPATLGLPGCVTENVIGLEVAEVGILPATTSVPEQDSVQLSVVVRDMDGERVDDVPVVWGVDPPWVASVSPSGVVRGLAAGPAIVTATFGGVSGSATVNVLGNAVLRADPDSVAFVGAAGGAPPRSESIVVSSANDTPLSGFEATVAYPTGTPSAWAELDYRSGQGPVDVEITPRTSGMPAGRYSATLLLTHEATRNSPHSVPLTLALASIEVVESKGSTVVWAPGVRDTLSISLGARPDRNVVLEVESRSEAAAWVEPEEFEFTPGNWDSPRVVVVTGGRQADRNLDPATSIVIEVDKSDSDPMYRLVDPVEVDVATGLLNGIFPSSEASGSAGVGPTNGPAPGSSRGSG